MEIEEKMFAEVEDIMCDQVIISSELEINYGLTNSIITPT